MDHESCITCGTPIWSEDAGLCPPCTADAPPPLVHPPEAEATGRWLIAVTAFAVAFWIALALLAGFVRTP
jgi:hypothetical protein